MVTTQIKAHGYPFEVASDTPLTEEELKRLSAALENYKPSVIKVLSEGRGEDEPPLRVLVSPIQSDWCRLSNSLSSCSIGDDPEMSYFALGRWSSPTNELLVRRYSLGNWVISHEVAHAVDDFGSVAYCILFSGAYECGHASEDSELFPWEPSEYPGYDRLPRLRAYNPYIFDNGWTVDNFIRRWRGFNEAFYKAEWFAAMAVCLNDPKRSSSCRAEPSPQKTFFPQFEEAVIRYMDTFPNLPDGSSDE